MGEDPETVGANKAFGLQIRKDEQHLVHVALQMPGFDQTTGAPLHKPFMQKFHVSEFGSMEKAKAFAGYRTHIVHDPRSENEIKMDLRNDTQSKPIERMNLDELRSEYNRLYAEPADDKADPAQLREAIAEKMQWLASESKGTANVVETKKPADDKADPAQLREAIAEKMQWLATESKGTTGNVGMANTPAEETPGADTIGKGDTATDKVAAKKNADK